MVRFSDVLTIVNGKNQSKVENPNGKYPIYGSGGVMGYADDYLCGAETVVIGRKGSINKPIYVEEPFWNVDTAFGLVSNRDLLLPKYLFYFCVYFDFEQLNTTVTIPSLTKANLLDIEMMLPSLGVQQEVVNRLSKVDELIALRKEQLAKLDQLVKSRFIELFGATSASSCTRQIKDYADVLGGYAFKSEMFCTDAIPVVRISNISNGKVELDYTVCFSEVFWNENKRFRAETGDILMAMSGATTGKAGLYTEKAPALINQRVACLRAKNKIACPAFLYVATQLDWMYDLIQESSAGCAQPNISGKQIENMPVPNATYEEQLQFAAFVEQVDKLKLAIQQSLDKLELLKKSLMQEYFG